MDFGKLDSEGVMGQRYGEIDDLTEDVRDRLLDSPWSWESFQDVYDISWIHHENGLEGVVLTYPEIKSAVDNNVVSDVSLLPTYQDIKNQKSCVETIRGLAADKKGRLSVELFSELHRRLMTDPNKAGVYRKDIPIHRTYFHTIASPEDIEPGLLGTLEYLRGHEDTDLHPVELAANTHHRFMHVFPFPKFSGFLGRLVMNFVLVRHGYLPAVIHATDRQKYYEALRGGEADFRYFLCEAVTDSLDNANRFLMGASADEQTPARWDRARLGAGR